MLHSPQKSEDRYLRCYTALRSGTRAPVLDMARQEEDAMVPWQRKTAFFPTKVS